MDIKERDIGIGTTQWKSQCGISPPLSASRHAQALHRIGLLDEEEMRGILFYADAASGLVMEELT